MNTIDAGTVKEMIDLSDELYEVLQLTTLEAVYEVLQVRHDDLTQFVLVHYTFDKELSMAEQSYSLNKVVAGIVYATEAEAKLEAVNRLMMANLNAM